MHEKEVRERKAFSCYNKVPAVARDNLELAETDCRQIICVAMLLEKARTNLQCC